MRPTKQLIRALRESAAFLRTATSPLQYSWSDVAACNCGVLAQFALGMTKVQVGRLLSQAYEKGVRGTWSDKAEKGFCPVTGQPLVELFQALEAVGLERGDFERVEWLDHSSAWQGYTNPLVVAAWMDNEADTLEARRAAGERP